VTKYRLLGLDIKYTCLTKNI